MTKKKFQVGKLYLLEWLDHFDEARAWVREEDLNHEKEARMLTVGWCLGVSDMYITLAGTKEINDDSPVYGQVFKCLKSDIQKAQIIKES